MRLLLLASLLLISNFLIAQRYSKVKIKLSEHQSIENLARLGLEVDHGEYRPGVHIINAFSEDEIQLISDNGIRLLKY